MYNEFLNRLAEIATDSAFLTAITSILLLIVGVAQVRVSVLQKRQTRISLVGEYRQQWKACRNSFGNIIYIGNEEEAFYQILPEEKLAIIKQQVEKHFNHRPTTWARESIQEVCGTLDEVCLRILQGHLKVSDAYPIFGTEFLRHTFPLRVLLDANYVEPRSQESLKNAHFAVREELQDWLIYHDGLRRRCLILIDLLWAEAARLEDLPPYDLIVAARAKSKTGKLNRKRIFKESFRLHGLAKLYATYRLKKFLKHSEFYSFWNPIGLKKNRLDRQDEDWTTRLLR